VRQPRKCRSDLMKPPWTRAAPNLNHNIGRDGIGPPRFRFRQSANDSCSFTTSFNLSERHAPTLFVQDLFKSRQVIVGVEGAAAPARWTVQQAAGDVVADAPFRDPGLSGKSLERKLRIWTRTGRIAGFASHRQAHPIIDKWPLSSTVYLLLNERW
jgi:hypothetical protein